MNDEYGPASTFLTWVISEDAPLTGSEYGEANLRKVIELTGDEDSSNRDWAAFLLANLDLNTPPIRAALTACADDPDEDVRAEGIRGLARKDAAAALPYVQRALAADSARMDIFEAAAVVAHPSLVEPLMLFANKKRRQGHSGCVGSLSERPASSLVFIDGSYRANRFAQLTSTIGATADRPVRSPADRRRERRDLVESQKAAFQLT